MPIYLSIKIQTNCGSNFYRFVFHGLVSVYSASILVHPDQISGITAYFGWKLNKLQPTGFCFQLPSWTTYILQNYWKNINQEWLKTSFLLKKVDLLSWYINIPKHYCEAFQKPYNSWSCPKNKSCHPLLTVLRSLVWISRSCSMTFPFSRWKSRESPPTWCCFSNQRCLKSKIAKPFKNVYSSPLKIAYNAQEDEQGKATP